MLTPSATARHRMYATTIARVLARSRGQHGADLEVVAERPVFVLGAPRSGTTFVAGAIGRVPGLVDLGELKPWKAAIPRLASLSEDDAARELRALLEGIRRHGLVRHLRAIEQSPETAFVLGAVLRAYPQVSVVHMIRDPRDVAASLMQKGWLREGREGGDDVGSPYGHHARFWVEPERATEFDQADEARRAGWAWRSYVTAARVVPSATIEVRYEELADDPEAAAEPLAAHLGADPVILASALSRMHAESVGRWRRNLTPEQVAEVESEAAELMEEYGYQ